ncbi:MAG: GGDEF domain-containing protein [Candidatus Omnitrophica bacterium]|nr:GGDEF domain-containing protein [Candidatus Omnitrophota bacterium]
MLHPRQMFEQLATRSFRWLFVACLLILGISVGVAGTIAFTLRHAEESAQGETRAGIDQAAQQLDGALQIRRERVLLLRDALDHAPQLSDAERVALAKSMVGLTPDLVGFGILEKGNHFRWWVSPWPESSPETVQLMREITRRTWWKNALRMSSRFVFRSSGDRSWWMIVEPFMAKANRSELIFALFDARLLAGEVLLAPAFSTLPLRLMGQNRVVHQSNRWKPPKSAAQPMLERSIGRGELDWVLQIPTVSPRMVPRAWLNVLLATISVLALIAALGMVWAVERLRFMATTDELTGLQNRRFFVERWVSEHARALRYQRPLSCLMMDVDRFKQVNDLLGHAAGDRLLKELARQIKTHLRQTDILARYGGDEFIVALPETDLEQARKVEEKLSGLSLPLPANPRLPGPITLSVGAAQVQANEPPEQAIQRADVQLALAKQARRNLIA